MCRQAGPRCQIPRIETLSAAGIQNDVARGCARKIRNCVQQGLCHPEIVQAPPPGNRFSRVPWLFRTAVLRLQQIYVAAACDIEGMSARADHSPFVAYQRQVASADGAQKHAMSLPNDAANRRNLDSERGCR